MPENVRALNAYFMMQMTNALPNSGGFNDQPFRLMALLSEIHNELQAHQHRKVKSAGKAHGTVTNRH